MTGDELVTRLIFSAIFFLNILAYETATAQIVGWQTFTSIGTIKDIDIDAGKVWSGSDGGVFQVDINSRTTAKFTNTEGLSANDVVAVEIDRHGVIWFALFNGLLNRYLPDTESWEVVEDYRGQQISDMVAVGDSLYVGLDIGVSLYTIDKMEVKETYRNLGLSSGDDVGKIGANAIFIDGTDIFVATSSGIARSSIALGNLQAPSSWVQYTTASGLPSNGVNDIVVLNGIPYAATTRGASRLTDTLWMDVALVGVNVKAMELVDSNQLFPENTVLSVTNDGVFWLDAADNWQRLGSRLTDVTAVKTDENGGVWIGRDGLGLASFNFDSEIWELVPENAPASNDFKSLLLDEQGRLWCASQLRGIHMLDNGTWVNFSRDNGLPSNDYRDLVTDAEGRIWAGSWGGGVTIIEVTPDDTTFSVIDTTGAVLAGFSGNSPGFVLVNGMARDQADNIWLLNREAVNTRVLASRTPQGEYAYFTVNEGLFTRFVTAIEIDQFDRVWVGTEDGGVRVLDHNNTLFDKSDDNFQQGLNVTDDGLFSNSVTALAEDRDGAIWIGTDEGLNLWFDNVTRNEFGIINRSITAIGIDGRNNKWIGTINGVTILRGHQEKLLDLTTGNSPLVSGNIQSFAFNEITGEVWIGTDRGLSLAQTLFTTPKEDLSQLSGFPNPFITSGSGERFTILNLAENTSVSIFNSAGRLIKTFRAGTSEIGAQAVWDGADKDGALVGSGIYVYLAYTDNDISATGKVAVIRR